MKLLLASTLLIIFISAFFSLFLLEKTIIPHLVCLQEAEDPLSAKCQTGQQFLAGLAMLLAFILIDAVTLYLFFSSLRPAKSFGELFF
ncbi:MAG: hypothetical protein DRP12_01245 [Candidatus Aenigmatarchaeota archaeon]|nr:MAG: hypothetical protein DRP12_01245 [Candidatus Aenigmarchaeota archaeon]